MAVFDLNDGWGKLESVVASSSKRGTAGEVQIWSTEGGSLFSTSVDQWWIRQRTGVVSKLLILTQKWKNSLKSLLILEKII